jgi:hypothetical protein
MGNWVSTECDPSTGLITKTRGIEKPSLNGGATCGPSQTKEPCKVDCAMSDWSMPSECDTTGFRIRTRTIQYEPRHGGATCGPIQTKDSCKIDCVMNDWSNWSPCDVNFKTFRTRTIKTDPLYGGAPCGSLSEQTKCISGPSGPLILLQTTGLIQTSGQGVIPNIDFSVMRVELIGGGGAGGKFSYFPNGWWGFLVGGGGGGGAGAYRDIKINNYNEGLKGLTYYYQIGKGGNYINNTNGQDTIFNITNRIDIYIAYGGKNGNMNGGGIGGLGGDFGGGTNGNSASLNSMQYITSSVIGGKGASTIYGNGGYNSDGTGAGSGGSGHGKMVSNGIITDIYGRNGASGGIIISYYK